MDDGGRGEQTFSIGSQSDVAQFAVYRMRVTFVSRLLLSLFSMFLDF